MEISNKCNVHIANKSIGSIISRLMAWEVGHKLKQDITAGYIILKQPIIEWSVAYNEQEINQKKLLI